jgi:hypothetical protein
MSGEERKGKLSKSPGTRIRAKKYPPTAVVLLWPLTSTVSWYKHQYSCNVTISHTVPGLVYVTR